MSKFFVAKTAIEEDQIRIEGEDANHIATVLRHKVGDPVTVCDGEQKDYDCIIEAIHKKEVLLHVVAIRPCDTEPVVQVTLFQGLPKGDKLEWIIQKCVELGVYEIIPVVTEYTVVKPDHYQKKIARYQKISEAAAKQSGRGIVPEVCDVMSFEEICPMIPTFDAFFVCYEKADDSTLKSLLRGQKDSRIGVFIGPEGGLSAEEVAAFEKQKGQIISLGKRILRTETAGMMFLSILLYELEDF